MENFNAKEYRDNLAKDLKEIRKTDPEKAQVVLDEAQQTEKYEKAEAWQKEKRDVMNEIGSEYILNRRNSPWLAKRVSVSESMKT